MSALKDRITEQVKTSMKARELEKVKVLRNVQSVIKQIEIDRKVDLDDAGVLEILQKQLKQRQESLNVFQDNGREDLAQKEQFEIDIINEFMPQQMSDAELAALINEEIAAQGASSMQDMGKVMGELKKNYSDSIDFSKAGSMLKELLNKQ